MSKDVSHDINLDNIRENFNKYTRKAFLMLPELESPRILDIGCGSGVPTIELAKLSNGKIIGIDKDQSLLDKLKKKIEGEGLTRQVKTKKCSLFEIDFPDASFDIIWAEGVAFVDFKKRLKMWKRLIKKNKFLVLHDDNKNISKKLKIIPNLGYRLVGHFSLPEDSWWTEYYLPLEKKLIKLRSKYSNDPQALKIIEKNQKEVDLVKKNPKEVGSTFYIMQKL
ncbi:MAG: class I SAM-dependent methyltransferase [Promethearchaeota archaeon]